MVLALLLAASCGGDSANPLSSTSTGPESTTTTTSDDPFQIDIFSIEPTPPSELPTGVNALLGGAPDEVATQAIVSDLEADGVDLTGVTIFVWPVLGTGESLVVVEFDESAVAYADEENDQGNILIESVLAHPVIDLHNITRLVMRIVGTDEEGLFVFTVTALVEDVRQGIATGESDAEGQFDLERVEP